MDDLDIILKIKNGDSKAYALIVEKYHRPLLTFIYRIVRDRNLVEDIGQEVFLSIYKALEGFDETRGTPLASVIFIAAKNRCISVLREKKKRTLVDVEEIASLADNAGTAEELLLDKEQLESLTESLQLVPEPFRTSLVLNLQGYSLERIAEMEGISTGTVKSRLFRAREKLKTLVSEYFGRGKYERI